MSSDPAAQREPTVLLRHGTTRRRADRILQLGPDPVFLEPGAVRTREEFGFSTARVKPVYVFGSPEDYAMRKAALFPQEGGPAILELCVPESILNKASRMESEEVRFALGRGLEELMEAWPTLEKKVISR